MANRVLITARIVLAMSCLLASNLAWAIAACPMVGLNSADVRDYYDVTHKTFLEAVNKAHFGPTVQSLKRGTSTNIIGADLTYILDRFPNHYRALDVASRLSIKLNSPKPPGARCTVDGWFERAIEFKPDDPNVRMTYGMHLYRFKKLDKAIEQFERADKLAPDNPNLAYNLGLVYFDLKQYDKAMAYAEKAYSADFPLLGLKRKLVKAGRWSKAESASPESEALRAEQFKPEETGSDELN